MQLKTILICKNKLLAMTAAAGLALLSGCANTSTPRLAATDLSAATWQEQLLQMPKADVPALLLLGEQHDALEHQQWQQATAQVLIARDQLAAVVLEMADDGQSTQGLPHTASVAEVQQALRWSDKAWPWQAYGPTIMSAVRAGVPVMGGNVPRAQMKDVMQQSQWDSHLPPKAWEAQREAIRSGHCDLLPESQLTPMARIQLAKDARMAHTAQAALQPQKTVLLIAGRGHVLRSIGIPTWLPPEVSHTIAIGQAGDAAQAATSERDYVVHTPATPEQDHCAALKARWQEPSK